MTTHVWTLRPLTPSDRDGVVDLVARVLGAKYASAEWWQWKYLANPAGPAIGYVAEVGTRVVGQYAAVPRLFRVGPRYVRAAHGIDLIVHPEFRRQGMFRELLLRICQAARSAGIELLYHTGNGASHPGMVSTTNYLDVYPCAPVWFKPASLAGLSEAIPVLGHLVPALTKAAQSRPLEGVPKHSAMSTEVVVREVDPTDSSLALVSERILSRRTVSAVRDRQYLAWRYGTRPDSKYRAVAAFVQGEPAAYAVLAVRRQGRVLAGFIAELEIAEDHVGGIGRALVSAVTAAARHDGAALLSSLTVPRSLEASVLRRAGFLPCPPRLMPRALFVGCQVLSEDDELTRVCGGSGSWYLSWGDHDAV